MRACATPIVQFAREMERLPQALASFKQGADTIGRIGADLEAIGSASESLRRGVAALARIETMLAQMPSPEAQLEEIKRGLERAGAAIESLAGSWSRRPTSGRAGPLRNSSRAA